MLLLVRSGAVLLRRQRQFHHQYKYTLNPCRAQFASRSNNKNVQVVVTNERQSKQSDNSNNMQSANTNATRSEELAKQKDEMDDEMEGNRAVFDSIFSTRRPKDGWAGLSSGLKSVVKGTGAGLASLVASPIVGAQQDGAKGFVTGLATGVATAVAFPVAGICVGAYQLGRGLVNSGEAMRCTQLGMLWKEETREWYFYELEKEQLELEVLQAKFVRQNESHASAKERVVTDRSYYDLLQVSTNATNVELKKAYYKMSRQVHPDRNPDDPRAAQKFQELSQAYQTLSNDQARAIYDKHGKSESNELDLADIDPYLFFAVMFGSEAVRPYIGELWIANKADSFMKEQMADFKKMQQHSENENDDDQDDDDSATTDERAFLAAKRTKEDELKQRRREVECALYLRERIAAFMSGMQDESDFVLLAQEEAATITKGCFGDIFCTTIGFALEMEALEFIGTHTSYFGMGGTTARMKLKTHSIGNNMKILGAGIGAARAGSQAYKEMEKMATQHRGLEEQQQQDGTSVKEATEKLEQSLPAFIELAWAINIQDISSLLKTVCHKVFHDGAETHSIEVRLKRAEAVHILGREFHNMGKLAKKTNLKKVDAQELRTRAECAAMQTMAKAQGQDLSGADAESMIRQARAMDAAQRSTAEQ